MIEDEEEKDSWAATWLGPTIMTVATAGAIGGLAAQPDKKDDSPPHRPTIRMTKEQQKLEEARKALLDADIAADSKKYATEQMGGAGLPSRASGLSEEEKRLLQKDFDATREAIDKSIAERIKEQQEQSKSKPPQK